MRHQDLTLPPDASGELSIVLSRNHFRALRLRGVATLCLVMGLSAWGWHALLGTYRLECRAVAAAGAECELASWFGLQRLRFEGVARLSWWDASVSINEVEQIGLRLEQADGSQQDLPGVWDPSHRALGPWLARANSDDPPAEAYVAPGRGGGLLWVLGFLLLVFVLSARYTGAQLRRCGGAPTTVINLVRLYRDPLRAEWRRQWWCGVGRMVEEHRQREQRLDAINSVGVLTDIDSDGDKSRELALFMPSGHVKLGKPVDMDEAVERIAGFLGLPRCDRECDRQGVYRPALDTERLLRATPGMVSVAPARAERAVVAEWGIDLSGRSPGRSSLPAAGVTASADAASADEPVVTSPAVIRRGLPMLPRKLALFVYGLPNLLGALLALLGLVLFFLGLIKAFWFVIVPGLYLSGYLLGAMFAVGEQAPWRQQLEHLDLKLGLEQLKQRVRGQVSPEVWQRVQLITELIADLIPRLEGRGGGDHIAFTVRQTALDYLPSTLENYLKLPQAYRRLHTLPNGKTPRQTLIEQLDTLEDAMRRSLDEFSRDDANALLAQERFLKDRFFQAEEF